MYSSNHLKFGQVILSNWIKDSENIARSAKEKFSKNIYRKRVTWDIDCWVIFPLQETDLVQRIKIQHKRGFHVSGRWVGMEIIWPMRKAFQEQDVTLLSIKASEFKASRVLMLKLVWRHRLSYKKRNNKKVKSEDELWKKFDQFHDGLRYRIKTSPGFRYNASNTDHKWVAFPPEHHYAFDQIPMQVFSGMEYMWADNGQGPTNISQPESGSHKRVASIQVLHRMAGPKPNQICVIFL